MKPSEWALTQPGWCHWKKSICEPTKQAAGCAPRKGPVRTQEEHLPAEEGP